MILSIYLHRDVRESKNLRALRLCADISGLNPSVLGAAVAAHILIFPNHALMEHWLSTRIRSSLLREAAFVLYRPAANYSFPTKWEMGGNYVSEACPRGKMPTGCYAMQRSDKKKSSILPAEAATHQFIIYSETKTVDYNTHKIKKIL